MGAGRGDDPDRLDLELEQAEEERQAEVGRKPGERDPRAAPRRDRFRWGRQVAIGDEGEDVARPEVAADLVEICGRGGHVN